MTRGRSPVHTGAVSAEGTSRLGGAAGVKGSLQHSSIRQPARPGLAGGYGLLQRPEGASKQAALRYAGVEPGGGNSRRCRRQRECQ